MKQPQQRMNECRENSLNTRSIDHYLTSLDFLRLNIFFSESFFPLQLVPAYVGTYHKKYTVLCKKRLSSPPWNWTVVPVLLFNSLTNKLGYFWMAMGTHFLMKEARNFLDFLKNVNFQVKTIVLWLFLAANCGKNWVTFSNILSHWMDRQNVSHFVDGVEVICTISVTRFCKIIDTWAQFWV